MKETSETRITLRDHEVIVENVKNGIPMNKRRVMPSNLALSMLGTLENEEIVCHLLKDGTFDEIFQSFFDVKHANGDSLGEEMSQIVAMAFNYLDESQYDEELVKEFYLSLTQHFDPTELSEQETISALKRFLFRIRRFEDRSAIEELFYYLLEEVNLLGELKGKYAGKILERLFMQARSSLNKELIHSLFQVTSEVAERDWIQEVLAQHIPKKKACTSPLLPKNCFIYQEMLDGAKIVGIQVEAQRFDIKYHRKEFLDVGHPNMLFLFTIRGQKVLNCKLVCVKDKILTPETQLYRYPFSNVYTNTDTCWPDLNTYRVKSIAHLGTMPFAFLHSINNEHLFQGVNLGEKYFELQGEDFDHETLKPLNKTMNEWLEVSKEKLN